MKVKILEQTHPSWNGEDLGQLQALHDGGRAWHALVDTWLPKLAREGDDTWAERKKLAGYVNHAGPIVSLLAALLFSEEAQVEGADGPYWGGLWQDCDQSGTPWTRFWRNLLEAAQVGRRAFVWVNMPSSDGVEVKSLADQDKAGLRDAFLVALSAAQVRNWGMDGHGLAWILARGVERLQEGPEAPQTKKIRWTAVTRTEVVQWEWVATEDKPAPGPDDEAAEVTRIKHGLPRLPVVLLELPHGLHTMGKLQDVAIKAAAARNDLDWALHQAANELLVIKSKASGVITLGHGAYLGLQPDDDANFIGPSGVAFEHLEKAVESHREDIYRLVHQMALSADASASSSARSGDSKEMDWQALGIILASYQDLVLGAMRETLQVVALSRGEAELTDEIKVSGLEGWRSEDLGQWLEYILLAVEAGKLSPTFRREVARVQAVRLLGDHVSPETMKAIETEISTADTDPLGSSFRLPGQPGGAEDGAGGQAGGTQG